MSTARVHYVKHARQTYDKVAKTDDEGKPVVVPVTRRRTGEQKTTRSGRPIVRRIRVADKEKPRELRKCGKCGDVIAIGAPYRWFAVGFRSSYRQVRCMKATCTPRPSELESSGIRAEILSAIEGAEDTLAHLDPMSVEESDVAEALQEVASALEDASSQWREADEAFGGGGNTENGERADNAESAKDELESWSTNGDSEPDFESCENEEHEGQEGGPAPVEKGDTDNCSSCAEIRQAWGEALIDEGSDALGNVDIP